MTTTANFYTAEGDAQGVSLVWGTPPTPGNALIAVVYVRAATLESPITPVGWALERESFVGTEIGVWVYSRIATNNEDDTDFINPALDADACVLHVYQIERPESGFYGAQIGTLLYDTQEAFTAVEAAAVDAGVLPFPFEAASIFVGAWDAVVADHVVEDFPDLNPDDSGRFVSGFNSATVAVGDDTAVTWDGVADGEVGTYHLLLANSAFSRVQTESVAASASMVLNSTPQVGNLLVAAVGYISTDPAREVTGWNLIAPDGATDSNVRVAIYWREVDADTTSAVNLNSGAPGAVILGMSVEEWTGFEGQPGIAGVAVHAEEDDANQISAYYTTAASDRINFMAMAFSPTPTTILSPEGGGYVSGDPVVSIALPDSTAPSGYPRLVGFFWGPAASDAAMVVVQFRNTTDSQPAVEPISFVFPDEGQRLYYTPGARRGSALTSTRGTEVTIYADAEATTLAVIYDLDDEVIAGSVLTVGDDSLLPQFKGPVDVTTLYAQVAGSDDVVPLWANLDSWRTWATENGIGGGGVRLDQENVWTARQNFQGGAETISYDIPGIGVFPIPVEFPIHIHEIDGEGDSPRASFCLLGPPINESLSTMLLMFDEGGGQIGGLNSARGFGIGVGPFGITLMHGPVGEVGLMSFMSLGATSFADAEITLSAPTSYDPSIPAATETPTGNRLVSATHVQRMFSAASSLFFDARPLLNGALPATTPDGITITPISDGVPLDFSPPIISGGAVRAAVGTPMKSGFFFIGLTPTSSGRVSMGWGGYDTPVGLVGDVHHNLSISHLTGDGYVLHVVATAGSPNVYTLGIGVDVIANAPDIFTMLEEVVIPEPVPGDIFAMGYEFSDGEVTLTAYRNGVAVFTITDDTWTTVADFTTSAVPLLQNDDSYYGRVAWVARGANIHVDPDIHPASLTRWAALAERVAVLEA